jgi:hypothetical protein
LIGCPFYFFANTKKITTFAAHKKWAYLFALLFGAMGSGKSRLSNTKNYLKQ